MVRWNYLEGRRLSRDLMDEIQGRLGLGGFVCVKSVWDVVLLRVFIFSAIVSSSVFAIGTRCTLSDGKNNK